MEMQAEEIQESSMLHKEAQVPKKKKKCLRTENSSSSGEDHTNWFSHTRWTAQKTYIHVALYIEQVVLYIFRNK